MTHGTACRCAAIGMLAVAGFVLHGYGRAPQRTPTDALGGPERYLTYVCTDKPIYRAGEKVYIRGVILRADTRQPLKTDAQVQALIEFRGPKGDVVAGGWVPSQDSVLGFTWEVPEGQAGGEYTAKIAFPGHGLPPAERKFDVRAYRAPRLKSQIVFLRDGYGPGDEVAAALHVERAEGGVPGGAKVTAIARVDGEELPAGVLAVDERGNCTAKFKLPAEIARGEGTIAFAIEDGGTVETAAKTIPILLQTIDLQIYPEGGDLVAGLPTRVYVEGRTPARKPADIAGIVIDAAGAEVARFRTEHEGRGRVSFTAKKGGQYALKIVEPSGIKTTYPLPAVKEAGAVIAAVEDVTRGEASVRLRVGSTTGGKLRVALCKREVEVASARVEPRSGELMDVILTPPAGADGVLIATVWDAQDKPLAERLIFRQPARSLRIEVNPGQKSYVPGDTVNFAVKTTDDAGKPVSAVVGLSATDDSVLEMIEKREQAPRLPVMVLLETDVRELADAHVYLDPDNAKAPLAVDLLLGTQGWRRFAFIETGPFISNHADAARRVLAMHLFNERRQRGFAFGGGMGGMPAGGVRRDGDAIEEDMVMLGVPAMAPVDEFKAANAPQLGAKLEANDKRDPAEKPMALGRLAAPVAERPKDRFAKEIAAGEEAELRQRVLFDVAAASVAPQRNDFIAVRVYAHALRPDRKPADRRDFTETLYWNAGLRTDEKTGEARVSFALSDAVTTFRLFADAFGADGALGQASTIIESVEPFYIEPKLPLEVTAGDVLQIPVSVVSGVSQRLPEVAVTAAGASGLKIEPAGKLALDAKGRRRVLLNVGVGGAGATSDFVVSANAGPYADKVTRKLTVKPLGFPVEVAFGGMVGPDTPIRKEIVVPESLVAGSLASGVAVYPTPLANLTEALERLIQEPSGCFEQTSSTVYPLVMAQQYFLSHTGVDPSLVERSRANLDKGHARLVSFECKQKGYEWFGSDPGHEALTAYGLLEFSDMSQVRDVDKTMITRTREWLLKRRDGKGGFALDSKALDSFGRAPADTTAAYIVWALLEAGEKGLEPEIAAIKAKAQTTQDSYLMALAANVLALSGDREGYAKVAEALVKKLTRDGSVAGGATSITCSGGEALTIETTSLAILAWLRDPAHAGSVESAIRYLADACKAGRYGSTQSTVLALRAIVQYDKSRAKPKAAGSLRVLVDGKPAGDYVEFSTTTEGAIKLPDITGLLTPGKHVIEVQMNGGSSMPCTVAVTYYDRQPRSSPECKVALSTTLAGREVEEGAVTEANVVVSNRTQDGIPMVVAIVGLPGGLEPRHDQLKELVKAGTVAAYEVLGREVVLYWRELKPKQEVRFPISLVAAVPGSYTGPASRTYLYYTDEFKSWTDGLRVTVRPRARE